MDPTCLEDPYEQQLFAVFNTYDFHHTGTLDHDGLSQLCTTLQLEERAPALIRCLLKNSNKKNVTFLEFKDALLQILRETQKTENAQTINDDESPDREVSPKYICGTKKYGRRSRPKEESVPKETNVEKDETKLNKIQRSSSHSDVHPSKKRKSNTNLKRCTSFPDAVTYTPNLISQDEFESDDFELSDLWRRLKMEQNGAVTQQDIKRICNSFDRNFPISDKTVEKLLSKLDTNDKKEIEYDEFVEFFSERESIESKPDTHVLSSALDRFQKNNCTQHITMCPDGSGVINVDVIVDMWENAGVASAYNLLCDLGFTQNQINISELTSVLDTELKNLNDSQENQPIIYSANPHEALLQASLTLYQSEVKFLKSAMKHMCAERDKLKTDISDAHARANLLTQEVDDNNAKMEKATREKVKFLEQRHAETLRDITDQLTLEREQSTVLHQKLEKRIKSLEVEEARLKSELATIQSDVCSLERENQHLLEQVSTLEQTNAELVVNIEILEGEKQKISDLEGNRQQEELRNYWEKIAVLQHEKNSLKDRNDELCIEVESLRGELSALKLKKSTPSLSSELNEETASAVGGITGFAIKRRGNDSSDLEPDDNFVPESPHLRKLRKFHSGYDFENLPKDIDTMPCTGENGLEVDTNIAESSKMNGDGNDEECSRLQARVAYLEQLLRQYGHDLVNESSQLLNEDKTVSYSLRQQYQKLESLLGEIKMGLQQNMAAETCTNIVTLKHFVNDLEVKVNESIDLLKNISVNSSEGKGDEENPEEKYQNLLKVNQDLETQCSELNDKYQHLLKVNKELETRCSELDNSLELMKTEYEKCEDYWASKLDEERQLFEQEQKQSNSKFQELFSQMTELEEQFAAQSDKLPTIDEASLEKQFTDLEDEYDKYKTSAENELIKQEEEIGKLKKLINHYENAKKITQDIAVQANVSVDDKTCETDSLTNYDVNQINLPFSSNSFNWNSASKFTLSQPNSIDSQISCDNQLSTISCPSSSLQVSPRQNDQSPNNLGGNYPDNASDTTALRSSPQVHRSRKHSVTSAEIAYRKEEIKRLRNMKSQLDEEYQLLLKKKDTLIDEITQLEQKAKESEEPVINFRWKGLRGYTSSGGSTNKQTCRISLSTLQELNIRLHQLDQRCKHLQQVLHKQQQQADNLLRQSWMQHKGEMADLQCMLHSTQEKLEEQHQIYNDKIQQLARTDLLVKELYIENSYLLATVQRLEHHCHMLTQANSNSSSV